MAVELFENDWPDYSDGNEHGGVSYDVDPGGAFFGIIKKVNKRNEIDPWRKNLLKAEKQGLDPAFDFFEREEGDAHYDHYADVNEQKLEFAVPIKFFVYETNKHPEKDPQKGHRNRS